MTTTPILPAEIYAVLAGPIDQPALQRILNSFSMCSLQGVERMHVLFQSAGGGIGEGVCLYNFFKTLSIDLTLYNAGIVASIAVVAFLGAKKRKTSRHAAFMIHRTQTTTQSANTQTVKAFVESAVLFDKNTEAILREHINMPGDKWKHFNHNDLWISAEEAVEFGVADAIEEFSPPPGTKLYNV